jgi:hypothetical protein
MLRGLQDGRCSRIDRRISNGTSIITHGLRELGVRARFMEISYPFNFITNFHMRLELLRLFVTIISPVCTPSPFTYSHVTCSGSGNRPEKYRIPSQLHRNLSALQELHNCAAFQPHIPRKFVSPAIRLNHRPARIVQHDIKLSLYLHRPWLLFPCHVASSLSLILPVSQVLSFDRACLRIVS